MTPGNLFECIENPFPVFLPDADARVGNPQFQESFGCLRSAVKARGAVVPGRFVSRYNLQEDAPFLRCEFYGIGQKVVKDLNQFRPIRPNEG